MPKKNTTKVAEGFSSAINTLTIGYVLALAIIGGIAATAHIFTGVVINAQQNNAAIINESGRQRMLSQRIAFLAQKMAAEQSNNDRVALAEAIQTFEQSHQALITSKLGDEKALSPDIKALLFDEPHLLDKRVQDYLAAAKTIRDNPIANATELTYLVNAASAGKSEASSLLASLDLVVETFQLEHEQQIAELKNIQNIALIVLAIVLAMEAILIFRPLIQRVNKLANSLDNVSMTDRFTGIKNRRGFMLIGDTVISQRQQGALIVLDIDHFKNINDQHGRETGDACIIHLTTVASAIFRAGDLFGRIGGEEFAAILPGASEQDALMVAERLRSELANFPCSTVGIKCSADSIPLTISVGVCAYSAPRPLSELLHEADAALYAAKRGGRNRVSSSSSMDSMPLRMPEELTVC
ncbi:MAG: diguanylate cyclase [Woeseiaceae bacterium]